MSVFTGEASTIYTRTVVDGSLPWSTWTSLLLNGGVALGLNIVSFTVSSARPDPTLAEEPKHRCSDLILTYGSPGQQKGRSAHNGRVCQCQAGPDDCPVSVPACRPVMMARCLSDAYCPGHRRAVVIFNLHINFVNLMGIALTILGGAWYSYIEVMSRGKAAPAGGAGTGSGTGPISTAQSSPSAMNGGFVASAQEEKERLSSGLGQSPNPGLRLGGAGSLSRAAAEAAPQHSPGGIPLYHRKAPNGSSIAPL